MTIRNQCQTMTSLIQGLMAMEAAIADFLKCLEVQENQGYRDLDAFLSRLPIPRKVGQTGVSVTAAIGGFGAGVLPLMEDEEASRFTPREVIRFQYAQDRRCVGLGYIWSILCLYTVEHEISSQLGRGGAAPSAADSDPQVGGSH